MRKIVQLQNQIQCRVLVTLNAKISENKFCHGWPLNKCLLYPVSESGSASHKTDIRIPQKMKVALKGWYNLFGYPCAVKREEIDS